MTDPKQTENRVAEWLLDHPDFLERHPDVLARLTVPHESGAASLLQRQVQLLREENQRLERQLKYLSGVAGENERLMQRLHRLSLQLVATADEPALLGCLDQGLRDDFRADAVALMTGADTLLASDGAPVVPLPDPRPDWLDELLAAGEPLCGRLTRDKRMGVFGEAGCDLGSVALVPIAERVLLAIGSRSDDRFHPGMGTLFLELLRSALRFRLDLDPEQDGRSKARA